MNKSFASITQRVVGINRTDLIVGDRVAIESGFRKFVSKIIDRDNGIFEIKNSFDHSTEMNDYCSSIVNSLCEFVLPFSSTRRRLSNKENHQYSLINPLPVCDNRSSVGSSAL